jgi:hypothetical protein
MGDICRLVSLVAGGATSVPCRLPIVARRTEGSREGQLLPEWVDATMPRIASTFRVQRTSFDDGIDSPHVDIVVNIVPIGSCTERKSVVTVRDLGDEPMMVNNSRIIALHNLLIQYAAPAGTARSHKGEVGTMHSIGTKVLLDGITMLEYYIRERKLLVNRYISGVVPEIYVLLPCIC